MTGHEGRQQAAETCPSEAEPQPPATAETAPAHEPAPARATPAHEPAPAGPFRGATPALGSAWLGAPGTLAGPSGIEPTTGAPLAMLPQRAPRAVPTWNGPTGGLPTVAGGSGQETAEEDDFWLPIEEVHWDGTPVQPTPGPGTAGRRTRPRPSPGNGCPDRRSGSATRRSGSRA
ncbi:hypothetical protein GCM10027615_22000 [Plantactinospora veratri]